jgi:hypothetical protein
MAGSSPAQAELPQRVIQQHSPTGTGERPVSRLVKARPVRADSPPGPQPQEPLQVLPASGIACVIHRPPVLCQEILTLAIGQNAEDALRIERILLLLVSG